MTQEPPLTAVAPAKMKTDRSGLLLALAAFVAVGGITFAIGRATAPASAATGQTGVRGAIPGASFDPNASFDPATMGRPGGGSTTVTGTVSAVSGSTLTLTTSDGRTVSVDASGATWHRQAAATSTDVTAGTTVQVAASGLGGLGGFGPGGGVPGASAATGASAAPAASAATATVTATDVTIVTK
jgi:hypothetical protein